LLKVKKSWLYDAVENGALEAIRLGKQLRFRPSALTRYLDEPGRVGSDVRRRGDGQVLIAMRNQHPTDMARFLMGRADH
jgi:excisionase family DNA binding protein